MVGDAKDRDRAAKNSCRNRSIGSDRRPYVTRLHGVGLTYRRQLAGATKRETMRRQLDETTKRAAGAKRTCRDGLLVANAPVILGSAASYAAGHRQTGRLLRVSTVRVSPSLVAMRCDGMFASGIVAESHSTTPCAHAQAATAAAASVA